MGRPFVRKNKYSIVSIFFGLLPYMNKISQGPNGCIGKHCRQLLNATAGAPDAGAISRALLSVWIKCVHFLIFLQ